MGHVCLFLNKEDPKIKSGRNKKSRPTVTWRVRALTPRCPVPPPGARGQCFESCAYDNGLPSPFVTHCRHLEPLLVLFGWRRTALLPTVQPVVAQRHAHWHMPFPFCRQKKASSASGAQSCRAGREAFARRSGRDAPSVQFLRTCGFRIKSSLQPPAFKSRPP